jgi:hypothetical protein
VVVPRSIPANSSTVRLIIFPPPNGSATSPRRPPLSFFSILEYRETFGNSRASLRFSRISGEFLLTDVALILTIR